MFVTLKDVIEANQWFPGRPKLPGEMVMRQRATSFGEVEETSYVITSPYSYDTLRSGDWIVKDPFGGWRVITQEQFKRLFNPPVVPNPSLDGPPY